MMEMELLDSKDGWVELAQLHGETAESALLAALDALKACHSCLPGGVHGDLRDANVMVRNLRQNLGAIDSNSWEVRFIDFEVGSKQR